MFKIGKLYQCTTDTTLWEPIENCIIEDSAGHIKEGDTVLYICEKDHYCTLVLSEDGILGYIIIFEEKFKPC